MIEDCGHGKEGLGVWLAVEESVLTKSQTCQVHQSGGAEHRGRHAVSLIQSSKELARTTTTTLAPICLTDWLAAAAALPNAASTKRPRTP